MYNSCRKLCTRELQIRLCLLRRLHPCPPSPRVFSDISVYDSRVSTCCAFLFPQHRPRPSFFSTVSDLEAFSVCWNCGEPPSPSGPFLFCMACRSVQPAGSSPDFFQIFGLERRYDLNNESLEGKYKEWQKKVHPDLVHSKSEREKSYAAEQSARVIDAYRTLSGPLSRAIYLLRLAGVPVDEERTVVDPELLSEMMDVREAVDEAGDPQELTEMQCLIKAKLDRWSDTFKEAFEKGDFGSAVAATQKMSYYERAIEEIVKKL